MRRPPAISMPFLMKGLQVPDRLHRFDAESSRKMAEVAKMEAKYW